MATLLVFHTQEWLVKYSKTIMDLWRRVIVFIILKWTNGEGKITVKRWDGMEGDGKDEVSRPKSARDKAGWAEKKSGGIENNVK